MFTLLQNFTPLIAQSFMPVALWCQPQIAIDPFWMASRLGYLSRYRLVTQRRALPQTLGRDYESQFLSPPPRHGRRAPPLAISMRLQFSDTAIFATDRVPLSIACSIADPVVPKRFSGLLWRADSECEGGYHATDYRTYLLVGGHGGNRMPGGRATSWSRGHDGG